MNIPFLFGGSGYYLAKGKDPYNPIRLHALLPQAQWNLIRHPFDKTLEPDGPYYDDKFGHVRLPIDPRCFLADSTGALPTSGADKTLSDDNIKALITQIERAHTAGLAIIIDLHPTWFNYDHYHRQRIAWQAAEPAAPWQSAYLGPWKYEMVTQGSYTTATKPGHPLVKFWHDFLTRFESIYQTLFFKGPTWEKLYLEVMNEPFIDLNSQDIDDAIKNLFGGWKGFLTTKCGEWRTVQAWAIQEIPSIDANAKVIATTAQSDPRELQPQGWKPDAWAINDPSYPFFGDKYTTTADGIDHPENVFYTIHLYYPVRYTDYRRFPASDPNYNLTRDYNGTVGPNSDPENRNVPVLDSIVGINYNDQALDYLIGKVRSWEQRTANSGVGITFTELGTQVRNTDYQSPPEDGESEHEGNHNGNYSGGDDVSVFRGKWMWDVRTNLHGYGYGLTVWDYCGGFRIWKRDTYLWDPNNFQAVGFQSGLLLYPKLGLFGVQRPQ